MNDLFCRQCLRKARARFRGLCTYCYTPADFITPPRRKKARNPLPLPKRVKPYVPRPTPQPTTARPGSEDKIAVLAERLAQGQPLWAEKDLTLDGLED